MENSRIYIDEGGGLGAQTQFHAVPESVTWSVAGAMCERRGVASRRDVAPPEPVLQYRHSSDRSVDPVAWCVRGPSAASVLTYGLQSPDAADAEARLLRPLRPGRRSAA